MAEPFLQASAGAYALEVGDAGIIDARGMTTISVAMSVGSSTDALTMTRVPSAAATSHSDGSTSMNALELEGTSSGSLDSTGVGWPFYWVGLVSTSTSGGTHAMVALV